jgi:23S rRNA A2030 N6-methylase RlmJ
MFVRKEQTDATLEHYREAIRALDMEPEEEAQFQVYQENDRFRHCLKRRLDKTRLWDYHPQQRDAVKQARAYLQQLIGVELSFHQ